MTTQLVCPNSECKNHGKPVENVDHKYCGECCCVLVAQEPAIEPVPVVEASLSADTEKVVPAEPAAPSPDQVPARNLRFWHLDGKGGHAAQPPKVRMVEPRQPVVPVVLVVPEGLFGQIKTMPEAIPARPEPAPKPVDRKDDGLKGTEATVVVEEGLLEPVKPTTPLGRDLEAKAAGDKPPVETVKEPPPRKFIPPARPEITPTPVVQAPKPKPVEDPQTMRMPARRASFPKGLKIALIAAIVLFVGALVAYFIWSEYQKSGTPTPVAQAKPVVEQVAAPKSEGNVPALPAVGTITAIDPEARATADQAITGLINMDGRVRGLENQERGQVIIGSTLEAAPSKRCEFHKCMADLLRDGDKRLLEKGLITPAQARESAERTCSSCNN